MQALKVILLVACLAGIASAAPFPSRNETCKAFVDKIKGMLPVVEHYENEGCKKLPEEEQEVCMQDVKKIINFYAGHITEEICQRDIFLPNTMSVFDLTQCRGPFRSMLCDGCKELAERLKAAASQLKDLMKQMCQSAGLPEKECDEAIDKMIDEIEKKSPEELCVMVGMCKK